MSDATNATNPNANTNGDDTTNDAINTNDAANGTKLNVTANNEVPTPNGTGTAATQNKNGIVGSKFVVVNSNEDGVTCVKQTTEGGRKSRKSKKSSKKRLSQKKKKGGKKSRKSRGKK